MRKYKIPTIGSETWKKQIREAVKNSNCEIRLNINPSYDTRGIKSYMLNSEYRKIQEAQLFLQEITK
jgi:hypothetical protein